MMTIPVNTMETETPAEHLLDSPTGHPRFVEVLPHVDPRRGGISTVVPQLGSTLAQFEGFSIDIAAFCDMHEEGDMAKFPQLAFTRWPSSRAAWLRGAGLRLRFRSLLSAADGLHIHGLWEASSVVAARTARSLRKPYVLSAHGMLEPWALANKSAKKKIYSALVERANVEGAVCLHALTADEAEDYRRFGSKRPIAIIPNGVEVPRSVDADAFLHRFPEVRGKRIVLFLGRVHFKKGLDLLVRAWKGVVAEHPDAILVIAGPDAENSQAAMERSILAHGIRDRVLFTGMLQGEEKWSALAAAEVFVLPSYSEGFSMAVLEAMGVGVPVIVTTGCHLPEVQQYGAGWQIRPEALELLAALQDVLGNSPAVNAAIGKRGRRLVQERFNWPFLSKQMAELYRWVLGGARPQTFEVHEVRP